jgi:hypothetical protein
MDGFIGETLPLGNWKILHSGEAASIGLFHIRFKPARMSPVGTQRNCAAIQNPDAIGHGGDRASCVPFQFG